MLKNFFKRVWKFCTEPSPDADFFSARETQEGGEMVEFLLTDSVNSLQKWLNRENFKEHIYSPEYHASSITQADEHSRVNLNIPEARKR